MAVKKPKPKFNVLNAGFKKRVKHRWRKPRGIDNKKRVRFAWAGASPRIGYKNSEAVRGLHPTGKLEILVHNEAELRAAVGSPDSRSRLAVRIASGVGKKKRERIAKAAGELGIHLLN